MRRAKSAESVGRWVLVSVERMAGVARVLIMLAVGMALGAAGLILLVPVVLVGSLHGWWASRRLSPIPQRGAGAGEVAALEGPGRVTLHRPTQAP